MRFCDDATVTRTNHKTDISRANNNNFPAIFPNLLTVPETLLPGLLRTIAKMLWTIKAVVGNKNSRYLYEILSIEVHSTVV